MRFVALPTVVKNLLIINGIMFLLTMTSGQSEIGQWNALTDSLGMHFIGSPLFRPWQLVTHMFMHGGLWHLFFNMFALFMFGAPIENRWGPKRFLTYYLLTGLGAVFLNTVVTGYTVGAELDALAAAGVATDDMKALVATIANDPTMYSQHLNDLVRSTGVPATAISRSVGAMVTPMVGASGAVFGILLAFGMLFPNVELMLLFPPIPIKAKYFVIGYGLLELYLGISNNINDNVAHFAHLGGMLFGFILIKYWKRRDPFL